MGRSKKDIEKKLAEATKYLKSIGCKEIILFGSLSDGRFDKFSDIDLAVSGISPGAYFRAVAVLSSKVEWKVDLVAMDYVSKEFAQRIRRQGRILYATQKSRRRY
jgi:predicted nucleotidyltransferase